MILILSMTTNTKLKKKVRIFISTNVTNNSKNTQKIDRKETITHSNNYSYSHITKYYQENKILDQYNITKIHIFSPDKI